MSPIKINLKPISRLNVFELPITLHNFQCKGQAGLSIEANPPCIQIPFFMCIPLKLSLQ